MLTASTARCRHRSIRRMEQEVREPCGQQCFVKEPCPDQKPSSSVLTQLRKLTKPLDPLLQAGSRIARDADSKTTVSLRESRSE